MTTISRNEPTTNNKYQGGYAYSNQKHTNFFKRFAKIILATFLFLPTTASCMIDTARHPIQRDFLYVPKLPSPSNGLCLAPPNPMMLPPEEIECPALSNWESVSEVNGIAVVNQNHFTDVEEGSILIFSHLYQFSHLLIYLGNQLIGTPEEFRNITHAALVAEERSDQEFSSFEIPDGEHPISKVDYKIDHLKQNENILFINIANMLPEKERDEFKSKLLSLTNSFVMSANQNRTLGGHYNFAGLARLTYESKSFSKEDWKDIINTLVDYHSFISQQKSLKIPKFFCSEFVLKKMQVARILQKYPELPKWIEEGYKKLNPKNESERKTFLETIYEKMNKTGLLKKVSADPFFHIPSRVASPADFLEFANKYKLPVTRIGNPNPETRTFLTEDDFKKDFETATVNVISKRMRDEKYGDPDPILCAMPEDLEKHMAYLEKEYENKGKIDTTDPSWECFTQFLYDQKAHLHFGYSQETFSCLLENCLNKPADQVKEGVAKCVQETFTLSEKIKLFFTALEMSRAIDRIIEKEEIKELLDMAVRGDPNALKTLQENFTDLLLPVEFRKCFSQLDLTCLLHNLENLLVRKTWMQNLSAEDTFKYLPIAFFGGGDVLKEAGMGEALSPMEKIQTFANENNMAARLFAADWARGWLTKIARQKK